MVARASDQIRVDTDRLPLIEVVRIGLLNPVFEARETSAKWRSPQETWPANSVFIEPYAPSKVTNADFCYRVGRHAVFAA